MPSFKLTLLALLIMIFKANSGFTFEFLSENMVMQRGHALQARGKPVKGSPSQKSEVSQRGQRYHFFTQETQEGVLSLARRCAWGAVIILLQDASPPTKEYLYILAILLSTFEYNGIAQVHAILLSTFK
ncbi:hypothetical protein F4604DRAFT_1689359 [Suillus subluteus]|nr:hypothetical protein F4604DRAFT_1689359 [Suillus subluteus]